MQFIDLASPFAIYEGGSGYVLPNVLPEIARTVLRRLVQEPVEDVITSLRDAGRQVLSRETSVQEAQAFVTHGVCAAGFYRVRLSQNLHCFGFREFRKSRSRVDLLYP